MLLWAATLSLFLSAQAAPDDVVAGDALREAPSTPAAPPEAPTAASAANAVATEARDVASLQRIEGLLSVGLTLDDADTRLLLALSTSPAPRARALCAAVLPWLDPSVSTAPLTTLTRDSDVRVRATAGQSLVALARRLGERETSLAVAAALALLDDPVDEVACAGAELLAALHPRGMDDAFEVRAEQASDTRYACFARFGGLPVRSVKLPALPTAPDLGPDVTAPPTSTPLAPEERPTSWIFIATAAGSGLLVGGALPAAAVPARDVLVYDDTFSRLSRQDISFVTQAGAALATAAAAGGGAWFLDETLALTPSEQIAVFGGAGSAAVLGAGLGFMIDMKGGAPALTLAGATAAGLVGATAVAAVADVTANDTALMITAASMASLGGGLGTFAAIPVALTDVGGVGRTDFGFGAMFAMAGVGGLAALGAAPFVEVPAARAAAVGAGGLLGAGLVGGVAFAVMPRDLEVGSRIAAGAGLAGQAIGMAAMGLFIPDAWLGIDDVDTEPVTASAAQPASARPAAR